MSEEQLLATAQVRYHFRINTLELRQLQISFEGWKGLQQTAQEQKSNHWPGTAGGNNWPVTPNGSPQLGVR